MKNNPTSIDRPSVLHQLPTRQRFQGTTYSLWDAYPTKDTAIEAGEGAETPQGSPEAYPVKALVVDGGIGAGRLRYGVYLAPKSSRKNPHRVKKNPGEKWRAVLISPKAPTGTTEYVPYFLLGGVKKHTSSWFPTKKNALNWMEQALETNLNAGRLVEKFYVESNAKKNPQLTIYNALKKKLGREPSSSELKAEVKRIIHEGTIEGRQKKNPPLMVIGNPRTKKNHSKKEVIGYVAGIMYQGFEWLASEKDLAKPGKEKLYKTKEAAEKRRLQLVASWGNEYQPFIRPYIKETFYKNPPSGDIMSDSVHEVRYTHRKDGQPYKHTFKSGVRMVANEDGTITMYHPTKRIHEEFPE